MKIQLHVRRLPKGLRLPRFDFSSGFREAYLSVLCHPLTVHPVKCALVPNKTGLPPRPMRLRSFLFLVKTGRRMVALFSHLRTLIRSVRSRRKYAGSLYMQVQYACLLGFGLDIFISPPMFVQGENDDILKRCTEKMVEHNCLHRNKQNLEFVHTG